MPDLNNNDAEQALIAMYFAYRRFTAEADEKLKQLSLQRTHHRILFFVGKNPNITVGELNQLLAVSKQTTHGPLRTLLKQNLVVANPKADDKRARCLKLTSHGQHLEAELTRIQVDLIQRAFCDEDQQSYESWLAAMHKIAVV